VCVAKVWNGPRKKHDLVSTILPVSEELPAAVGALSNARSFSQAAIGQKNLCFEVVNPCFFVKL
jgi:hypothetical protein